MLRSRGGSMVWAVVLLFIFFFMRPAAAAHGDHVVIAEVQVSGTNARDEFVELYNPTAAPIAVEGWRLSKRTGTGAREENLVTSFPTLTIPAHGSVLVAHPEGSFASAADQRYTTQSSLANDNTVVLYGPAATDGERPVIDLIGFGTVTSKEGTAAPNPPASQSLERKPGGVEGNGQDSGNNAADFVIQATPTPQPASTAARPAHPSSDAGASSTTDTGSGSSGSGSDTSSGSTTSTTGSSTATTETPAASSATTETTSSPTASSSAALVEPSRPTSPLPAPMHVRINEFVADPADGDEWIELVNVGPTPVNLADWVIEDGAETRTVLTGAVGIGEQRFTVITKPKGQLNNSGDRIVLKNSSGNLVDAVSYGEWSDGKTNDNAPAVSDPASVARVVDGVDTDNDRADFVRTETPTRGAPNMVSSAPPAEEHSAPRSASAPSVLIVLNELYPNPPGDDRADEFIEIANLGQQAVDLAGWRIRDALGTEYVVSAADGATSMLAGAFLILPRARTGIALNDTGGETIRLFKPGQERAASVAEYSGSAAEGVAWARANDGRWGWTTKLTVGAANAIASPNRAPDAAITVPERVAVGATLVVDGSDSADPDRDALAYLWNFGDERTEADVATDAVARYVYERPGTYTVSLTVTDARGATATEKRRVTVQAADVVFGVSAPTVHDQATGVISSALRLSEIVPNPIGSDTEEWMEIENTSDVPAPLRGWTLVIPGPSERRALLTDGVVPARGFSVLPRSAFGIALRNDGASMELHDPPGVVVDTVTYSAAREGWSFARGDAGVWEWTRTPTPGQANMFSGSETARAASGRMGSSRVSVATTLRDIDDVSRGDHVIVRGVVTAPPGSIGKQVFSIADDGGGVEVFFGTRKVPALSSGDRVEVRGELREVSGSLRVGIAAASDVRVLGKGAPMEPASVRVHDASAERIGALIAVEGEVVEVRGRTIHLDDGSDEIRVAIPESAAGAMEAVRGGDTIRVAGILSRTSAGYRVLARSADDIATVTRAVPQTRENAATPVAPLRNDLELAMLSGGGSVLVASTLWRRRRMLLLAASGIRRIATFSRRV